MNSSNSVWHTTSTQRARELQTTYNTTSVAGYKRTLSESLNNHSEIPTQETARPASRTNRSLSLTNKPPQLTASPIVSLISHHDQGPSEYTQRVEISATPSSTTDPLLSLSHRVYGLPAPLVENFRSLGIKDIYPWQKYCLLGPGLLSGEKNLVYSAPTGGGKSLVADGELSLEYPVSRGDHLTCCSLDAQESLGRQERQSSACIAICFPSAGKSQLATQGRPWIETSRHQRPGRHSHLEKS
jgi:hypothetical protein